MSNAVPVQPSSAHPAEALDKRINAYRPEVADAALEGKVNTKRFVRPVPQRLVGGEPAMMRGEPQQSATATSELLPGQRFDVLDTDGGWAWGYSAHDHYVGYIRADNLKADAPTRTHRITAPTALCFARPDIKSDVAHTLPMNAEAAAEEFDSDFLRLRNGTFVHRRHIGGLKDFAASHVEVAQSFIGTPYRWGGRRRAGIDCSGLVQIALAACGVSAPRDCDLQAAAIGKPAAEGEYHRGDIVFFPGHVGIMVDETNMLHANAYWMTTLVEPLSEVVRRLRSEYDEPITAVRRL